MRADELDWEGVLPLEDEGAILEVERRLGINFPASFTDCVKKYNSGCPVPNDFDFIYPGMSSETLGCIASLLSFDLHNQENILELNLNPPEFFPKGLIAFGGDGGGDLLCFDYRNITLGQEPTVVYWSHDAFFEDEAVIPLAANFEEFLNMLHEPKQI
jgi:hypothetical protein